MLPPLWDIPPLRVAPPKELEREAELPKLELREEELPKELLREEELPKELLRPLELRPPKLLLPLCTVVRVELSC